MITPGPVQTTYNQYMFPAQVGMPATETGWDADTRLCEDPLGNGIGFGLAVCQGTLSDRGATLGHLSGGIFVGITMADKTLPNLGSPNPATDMFGNTDNMGVMVRGDIWVAAVGSVIAGGPVYFNSVTGELGNSSIPNAIAIPNAVWMRSQPPITATTVPQNGLSIVRLSTIPAA